MAEIIMTELEIKKKRDATYGKAYRDAHKEEIAERWSMYYLEKYDTIRENKKIYREANKEKIKEHKQKLYICECGCEIKSASKYKHETTQKHKELMIEKHI